MKRSDARSMLPILRAWLDGGSPDDDDRYAGWIAEFIVGKAISGHFAYFKLVLDLVEGKLHRTAEDEMAFGAGCVLVVADDGKETETAKAA